MGVQIAKVACLRNGSDTNLNPLEPIMKTTTVIAAQIEVLSLSSFPLLYFPKEFSTRRGIKTKLT